MPSFNDVFSQITAGKGAVGNNVQANRQPAYNAIVSSFKPGQYAQANAQTAAKNPASYKDVPSLNQALKAGLINQSQWMQQFKQIQPKQPKIDTSVKGNLNPFSGQASLHQALDKIFIESPKAAVVDTKDALVRQAEAFAAPRSTDAQRQALMKNQSSAAKNPEYLKAVQGLRQGDNSVAGSIQAQKMAASGAKAPQIKAYLQKDAQAVAGQHGKAINAVLNAASVNVAGGGVLSKALDTAKAAAGKNAEVNSLIDATRAAQAYKAATVADKLGTPAVKEANTTRIPVREPTTTKIPVGGKSTQVTGKVTTASDSKYIAASNKLSTQYEKELAQIQKVPHPVTQQVLQRQLDTKYNTLQEKLDSNYGKSVIDFKGKPTVAKTQDNLPKSALNREPPTPFNSTRIAVQDSPALPTESPKTTSTPVEAPRVSGQGSGEQKVAGSSIRIQARAVEAGMKSEADTIGATYSTVSHKEEAAKATQLLQDNPEKAKSIALGARGDNASHEAAVYHAVANDALAQAKKTGDYSEVTALANSPRHTTVSEAAQKLGAEGYNVNPHDPINIMNEITKTREAQVAKRGAKTTVAKETANISKEVRAAAPKITRQDWHSFIQELQCK